MGVGGEHVELSGIFLVIDGEVTCGGEQQRREMSDMPFDHDEVAVWVRDRLLDQSGCQYNRVLTNMAEGVLDYCQSRNEPPDQVRERLDDAETVLRNVCYGMNANIGGYGNTTAPLGEIWVHRTMLLKELSEGYKYEAEWISKDEAVGAAAMLIERPWLDVRLLEHALIDALVCEEVRQFGRSLLETAPGPIDELGQNAQAGNQLGLHAVTAALLRSRMKWWAIRIAAFLLVPAAAIWMGTQVHLPLPVIVGGLIAGIYLTVSVGSVLIGGLRWALGKPKKKHPFEVRIELWEAMHAAYRSLSGTVIDPTMSLKALQDAAAKGAVWDGAVYALLNRVIARNPHAWVTEDDYTPRRRIDQSSAQLSEFRTARGI